jgi:hypothetical protein
VIPAALVAGVRYLTSAQEADGRWVDYRLPVGSSDGWVTAYTVVALAAAARLIPNADPRAAALRGAGWLSEARDYEAGWGFNATTGADADSTAWALRALRVAGIPAERRDVDFLLAHWTPSGGVATYHSGPGHWGDAHPDVTPVALLALPPGAAAAVTEATTEYLAAARRSDGAWPAYWWRTAHYSTLRNVELRARLGRFAGDEGPVVEDEEPHRVRTAFELACVVETAALVGAGDVALALALELISMQLEDGRWPASEVLRVTDHEWGERSSTAPRGRTYADDRGILTTATAVGALARCLA